MATIEGRLFEVFYKGQDEEGKEHTYFDSIFAVNENEAREAFAEFRPGVQIEEVDDTDTAYRKTGGPIVKRRGDGNDIVSIRDLSRCVDAMVNGIIENCFSFEDGKTATSQSIDILILAITEFIRGIYKLNHNDDISDNEIWTGFYERAKDILDLDEVLKDKMNDLFKPQGEC